MKSENRSSHAVILGGSERATEARAMELAALFLCSGAEPRPCGACRSCRKLRSGAHPDLIILERAEDAKGKKRAEIYVDQIRELVATAPILPNEAERKVYLIREADMMNTAAQNALLKVLEEPPAFVSFILCAANPAALLETVRSRCALENLAGETERPPAEALERARAYLDAVERGGVELVRFSSGLEALGGAELREFCRAGLEVLTDMLSGREAPALPAARLMALAELLERTDRYLDFNVNVKHLSGMILARSGINEDSTKRR